MAVTLEVIRQLTVQAKAEGVDAATRALNGFVDAQRGVAASSDSARQATDRQAGTVLSAGKSFEALERRISPVARANAELERGQRTVTSAINEGAISAERAAKVISLMAARHAQATGEVAHSTGLARHELINLGRQAQDVAVSLAGGQSPMTVLMQQGSQVADVFMASRTGPAAALKGFGAAVVPFLVNPLTLLGVTLGSVGVAAYQFSQQQDQLARALNGVGRAAGVSVDGLRAYGVEGARRGGIAASQGIDIAGQLAGTGRIGGAMMPGMIEASAKYSRAFGMDLTDAAKELGDAFADPTKGADKLNERMGFLDAATRQTIRTFQEQGDILGAQGALFAAFNNDLKNATEKVGLFERAWRSIKGVWGNFEQGIGGALAPTLQQQLDALESRIKTLDANRSDPRQRQLLSGPGMDTERAKMEVERDYLRRRITGEQADAEAKKAAQEAARRSREADDLMRQIVPELGQRQSLVNRRANLGRALDDPEVVKRLGDNAGVAREAFDRLGAQLIYFRTPTQRIIEDSQIAVREITARTFAERSAVEMEKARLNVLRESGDVAQAAASAEAARNRLIAEGNAQATQMLRSANDNLAMAKMRPYERAMAEIDIKYRDFREKFAPQGNDALVRPFGATAQAADNLTRALTGAAGAVGGGAGAKSSLPILASGNGFLDAVMRAEGTARTGDPYNTSLGYRASPKPLVTMTMDESLAWGEKIAREEMARLGVSRGEASSAKGAFQIVNSTQRAAMQALGMSGSDLFSADNQNRMAEWIRKTQGVGAWEGFKKNPGALSGVEVGKSGIDALKSTAGADSAAAQEKEKAARAYELIDAKIREANDDIDRQNSLLDVQAGTFGKTAGQIAEATRRQEMLNLFMQQGVPITEELTAKINEYAAKAGLAAQKGDDLAKVQRNVIGDMDAIRGAARDGLGTFINDLRQGKSAGEAFADALTKIEDKLMNRILDKFMNSLFGESGSAQGGLFGGFFSAIFGSHEIGGVVGAASTFSRVPLSAFIGAPHFASGGMVGGARPIIAHDGEIVLNAAQQANTAAAIRMASRMTAAPANSNAVAAPVSVNLYGAPAGTRVEQKTDQQGGQRIEVIMDKAVARSIQSDRGAEAMSVYGARKAVARR